MVCGLCVECEILATTTYIVFNTANTASLLRAFMYTQVLVVILAAGQHSFST